MVQVSKQSFLGGLCSEQNAFSRAAGVRCARSEIFFHGKLQMDKLCLEPKYLVNILKNEVARAFLPKLGQLKIPLKPTKLQSENRFTVSVFKPFTAPSGRRRAIKSNI